MHRVPRAGLLTSLAFLAVLSTGVPAAFATDINGAPICTAANDQLNPVTVSDGAGGIIVAWLDGRPTATGTVFVQRLDAAGVPQWTLDGVQISTTNDLNPPVIAPDGAGGAFIAFGGASSAPRAQRVDASGVPQWGAGGVALTTASGTRELAVARDIGGAGGAFFAWRLDNGAGGTADVYAQKLDASGTLQWGALGIAIANTNMNAEENPAIVSDGVGGAMFAWISSAGVRAQRRNAAGAGVWSQVSLAASGNKIAPSIVSDGASGAVIAWSGGGAFIQRVTSVGVRLWGSLGGITLSLNGRAPELIADGAGSAIVTWEDNRSTTNYNIYAQRMDPTTGAPLWVTDGTPICTETADQRAPQIASDGSGGAIISWYDARQNPHTTTDIYAQRIDGTGLIQWPLNGVAVCVAPNNQDFPTMASDGAGGAWVAWQDLRSGTNEDIYAARVNPNGDLLSVPPGPRATDWARAWPDPFSDHVAMEFVLPAAATVRTRVYDLHGRVVADLGGARLSAGPHQITWDGRARDGRSLEGGIYFMRAEAPGLTVTRSVVRLK